MATNYRRNTRVANATFSLEPNVDTLRALWYTGLVNDLDLFPLTYVEWRNLAVALGRLPSRRERIKYQRCGKDLQALDQVARTRRTAAATQLDRRSDSP